MFVARAGQRARPVQHARRDVFVAVLGQLDQGLCVSLLASELPRPVRRYLDAIASLVNAGGGK